LGVALVLREPDTEGQLEGEPEGGDEKEGEAEALGEPLWEGEPERLTRPALPEARGEAVVEDDTLREREGLDVALRHTVPLRERVAQDVALRERVTLTVTDSVGVAIAVAEDVEALLKVDDEEEDPLAVSEEKLVREEEGEAVEDAVGVHEGCSERPALAQPGHEQSVGAAAPAGQ
jgi:hypothetical protein